MNDTVAPTPVAIGATPPTSSKIAPGRLWFPVFVIILQWLIILLPRRFDIDTMLKGFSGSIGTLVGVLGVLIWWLGFSRLPWSSKLIGFVGLIISAIAVSPFLDPTMQGMVYAMVALPIVTTAWVAWLVLTPMLRWNVRLSGLLLVMVAGWGVAAMYRSEGVWGRFSFQLYRRWETPGEQKFLADRASGAFKGETGDESKPLKAGPGDWPSFRGPNRDSRFTGLQIATDWKAHAPKEIRRHRVGPGWSSFAVVGNRIFTQEQIEAEETVVCYNADTGKEVWEQKLGGRFDEAMGGLGPRTTPTFYDGKIYALAAKGTLKCMDAATGKEVWAQDITKDAASSVPYWGFSASPLVVKDIVTVFAAGDSGKSVLAYHAQTGKPAWSAGDGKNSYSSVHRAVLAGVEQLLMFQENGLTSLDPVNGKVLWKHDWDLVGGMPRCVQPAILGDSGVLLGCVKKGARRLEVTQSDGQWSTKALWTKRSIFPYYNDFVVHKGFLYGFDGDYFTCVSLEKGESQWRYEGYESGQVLLLADQDLLLILGEKGNVALVKAQETQHELLSSFEALPEGKCWNHPVVANGRLYIRNDKLAACYQLPVLNGN